jgi:hypothetical protein
MMKVMSLRFWRRILEVPSLFKTPYESIGKEGWVNQTPVKKVSQGYSSC